jgi:hypothetical protein
LVAPCRRTRSTVCHSFLAHRVFPTLKTLADVRTLMQHLPDGHRQRSTWQHVAKQLAAAADGGDINDAVIALRLVLQLENVPCLPQ